MMCQVGKLAWGKYIHVYDNSTRSPVLARAELFLEINHAITSSMFFFVVCNLHVSTAPGQWTRGTERCVSVELVLQRAVVHSEGPILRTVVR